MIIYSNPLKLRIYDVIVEKSPVLFETFLTMINNFEISEKSVVPKSLNLKRPKTISFFLKIKM